MEQEEKTCEFCGYNKKTLTAILVLLIVAVGAFYIGAKYEKNKLSRLGLINDCKSIEASKIIQFSGEIISKTGSIMIIKAADASTQTVTITPSTRMSKKNKEKITDLAIGQQVLVKGVKDDSGAFLAQVIQFMGNAVSSPAPLPTAAATPIAK